ncbi:hypothetical protein KP509_07G006200 [Ceratopteris richardii]|uniref:CCHC-type domain-containing protein n=1 Tax=Ceratopteris richardii TaxID=49495 RepID=A0A8T2UC05_CERRI|nr:hypothetical protein KP509_07G006200 [Ceratopteris richardii]
MNLNGSTSNKKGSQGQALYVGSSRDGNRGRRGSNRGRGRRSDDQGTSSGFFNTRGRGKSSARGTRGYYNYNQRQRSEDNNNCYICARYGHYAKDCYQNENNQSGNRRGGYSRRGKQ